MLYIKQFISHGLSQVGRWTQSRWSFRGPGCFCLAALSPLECWPHLHGSWSTLAFIIMSTVQPQWGKEMKRRAIKWGLQVAWFPWRPGDSDGKETVCNAGDPGLIPGSGADPLEKGMVTHSSILAWELQWTKEPSRLQSMGWLKWDMTEQLTLFTSHILHFCCCLVAELCLTLLWPQGL